MQYIYKISFLCSLLVHLSHTSLIAQSNGAISGTVKTRDGNPAAFINVALKDTRKGAITSEAGIYLMKNIQPGTYTLVATLVGVQPQEKTVTVVAGQTAIANFELVESTTQLNEVEVTANTQAVTLGKAGLAPLDLPQMTGVVSNVVITNQQASRLGDVLRNISGVSLTQQRQGTSETFSARGYSIGIGGGSGSIFKNGILTNTSSFPEASTLESVEVLKGASSLLYGNVSGGLIINMVTKKPRYNWGGEVSMRVGSYGLVKPIVDVYGPLTKNLAFRVVGTYEKANSYRDIVKTDRLYVNPSLLYKFGSKTTLLVEGDYLKANQTPDFGIGALVVNTVSEIPNLPRSRFINVVWAYNNTKQGSANATLTHQFNDRWKVNLIAGGQQTDISSFGVGVPNNVAPNGVWNRTLSRGLTSERNNTIQANMTGRFNTGAIGHQLLVGADRVQVTNISNSFTITSGGKAVTTYDQINILNPSDMGRTDIPDATALARTSSPSIRAGVYIQDLISLTDKFKVLAGVRWSAQKTVQTTIRDLATGIETRGTAVDKTDKAFSPKLALIYQPLQTTSFFASYTNNFVINTGIDIYGQNLAPSIVNQYEAGVKNELLGGRLTANVGVYRINNSNLAQMALTAADGTTNANTNVKELTGQTTSDGLEVDLTGNLSRNAYFIVGYGYNYMRYTKTSAAKGSYVEGERLTINPAHTANATLFYTFTQPTLRGLKLGASAFYTGARYGGYNNTKGQTQTDRRVPLTAFTTLDLTAGYTWKKITLLAKLSNITNELNYLIHDNYSINPIPPRQYTTTLSYRF